MLEGPAIHAGVVPPKTKRQRVMEIIKEEAAAAGVPVADVLSRARGSRLVVRARRLAIYRARQETGLSDAILGSIFLKDESAIRYAARDIALERGEKIPRRVTPHRKWTNDELAAEAAKHESRIDFFLNSPGAYHTARRRGLLNDICPPRKMPKARKWPPEIVAEEAAKYQSRTLFARGSCGAYKAARRFGILDEVCAHMLGRSPE